MTDYNTDQWIIIHYPQAAGGKFLAACFMMFDKVTNWSERETPTSEIVDWYKKSMPDLSGWFKNEIDTPWVLPASRLWPRGSDLSNIDFWSQFKPTPWFTQSWLEKKFIVDFWHKSTKPSWWSNARWIKIEIDDADLYKKLLFSKVFEYNEQTKTVVWASQIPSEGRPAAIANKAKYQNQFEWHNIDNLDAFYNEFVCQHECFKWISNDTNDKSITLTGLFNIDKLINFLLQFESCLNSKLDVDSVMQIHNCWSNKTKKLL